MLMYINLPTKHKIATNVPGIFSSPNTKKSLKVFIHKFETKININHNYIYLAGIHRYSLDSLRLCVFCLNFWKKMKTIFKITLHHFQLLELPSFVFLSLADKLLNAKFINFKRVHSAHKSLEK